jgi:hypothetical protein
MTVNNVTPGPNLLYVVNNHDRCDAAGNSAVFYAAKILSGTVKITWVPCPGADWMSQLP